MPRSSRGLVVVGCLALACCRFGYDAVSGAPFDGGTRVDATSDRDATEPGDANVSRDAGPSPPTDASVMDAARSDATMPDDADTPDADTPDADTPDARDAAPPIDAGPCGAPPTSADYCAEVPALAAPPVIDGVLECGLALRPIEPRGWTGANPIPAGTVARFAYAWRTDGVYAFVDVDDPRRTPPGPRDDVYCGAGAEIHVDSDGVYTAPPFYDNPGTRQFIATAPVDDTTPAMRGTIYWTNAGTNVVGPWSTRYVVTPRPGGYSLEAFVNAEDLGLATWTLASGQHIGIDIAINVAVARGERVDCGERLGQYFLGIHSGTDSWCEGLPFCDVRAFCNPRLTP